MNESVESNHENSMGAPLPAQAAHPVLEQAPQVLEQAPQAMAAESIAEVADMPAVADDAPRVGRYTHAELAAMQGKRGRKPPEFYALFPKADAGDATAAAKPGKSAQAAGATGRRSRAPAVRISSATIGEHTIDELLEMVGVTGKKPVAFDILRQAAQLFADRGALDLPKSSHDPLAQQVADAPAKVRAVIAELLRLGTR